MENTWIFKHEHGKELLFKKEVQKTQNKASKINEEPVWFKKGEKTSAATAKSLQSCLTLCHPIDGSPSGSPVPGILQARTLEWFAISFSNAWKWKVKVKSLSHVWLLVTPWTAAYQAPLSTGFSRQEYWSRLGRIDFTKIIQLLSKQRNEKIIMTSPDVGQYLELL